MMIMCDTTPSLSHDSENYGEFFPHLYIEALRNNMDYLAINLIFEKLDMVKNPNILDNNWQN